MIKQSRSLQDKQLLEINRLSLFVDHIQELGALINFKTDFRPYLQKIVNGVATYMNANKGIIIIKISSEFYFKHFGMQSAERVKVKKLLSGGNSIRVEDLKKLFSPATSTLVKHFKIAKHQGEGLIFFINKETRNGFIEFNAQDKAVVRVLANSLSTALMKLILDTHMRNSIALLHSVIDSVPGAVAVVNNEFQLRMINKKATAILGLEVSSQNKKITEFLPPLSPVRKYIEEVMAGSAENAAYGLLLSAKTPKVFNVFSSPHTWKLESGKVEKGYVFTFDDVTEIGELKSSFSKYVSRDVYEQVLKRGFKTRLGGSRIKCAVFFSDIRGFTSFSEKLDAEEVVETLNQYFNLMLSCVTEYGGYIDKLVGDEIMAIYKESEEMPNPSLNAVKTAVKMKEALSFFNEMRVSQELPPIYFGVGINYGDVISGNIGSFQRMDYTIIGDNVNLGARLCGHAGKEQIVLSASAAAKVGDQIALNHIGEITVKGKELPLTIYEVQ